MPKAHFYSETDVMRMGPTRVPIDPLTAARMDMIKSMGQAFYDYLVTLDENAECPLMAEAKLNVELAVMLAVKSVTR